MTYYERSRHRRRLTRSRDGLSGVCGGIADYFGLRRWAVRLVALIAIWLFLPVSLLVYLALALMMPPSAGRVCRHADDYLKSW